MYIIILFFLSFIFSNLVSLQSNANIKKKMSKAEADAEKERINIRFTIKDLGIPYEKVDDLCKNPSSIKASCPVCSNIDATTTCEINTHLISSCNDCACSCCGGIKTQIIAQCQLLNTVTAQSKFAKMGQGLMDGFMQGVGSSVVNKVTDGLLGKGGEGCLDSCKQQVISSRGPIKGALPSYKTFDQFYDDVKGNEKEMLEMCMCNSSCYTSYLTKDNCDIMLGNKVDCNEFKRGGKYASGMTDKQLEEAKGKCICKQMTNETGLEYEYSTANKTCLPLKEETEDPSAEFAGGGGDSFVDDAFAPNETKKDDKKDDKKTAAAAAGGASGLASAGKGFNKAPQQWKPPYRKNDGVSKLQDSMGRGAGSQAYKQNFKADKGKNEFIAKKEELEAAKKDIMDIKVTLLDEISGTYRDKIIANAFLFVPLENTNKEPNKNLKKVKRGTK